MIQEQATTSHLKEYLEYIGGHPDTKVVKEFVCDAFRGEEISWNGIKLGGQFFIYPEFCAFLSTMRGEQNTLRLFAHRFWDDLAGELKVAGLASRPEMLVVYVARSIGRDKDEQVKKYVKAALTNPNSFFIPMREIRSVSTGRKNLTLNTITIDTDFGRFTLTDNYMTTVQDPITWGVKKLSGGRPLGKPTPTQNFRYFGRLVTGRWEEDAVKLLKKAARANRSGARSGGYPAPRSALDRAFS
jgi:hypothetical protein